MEKLGNLDEKNKKAIVRLITRTNDNTRKRVHDFVKFCNIFVKHSNKSLGGRSRFYDLAKNSGKNWKTRL